MADVAVLRRLRSERFFSAWDEFLSAEHVTASEESVGRLIDDLLALGRNPSEQAARQAVSACVCRFNDMDDGWICTLEREDIYEQIGRVVDACGFDYQEDWVDAREW
jgi:hypothetical protein